MSKFNSFQKQHQELLQQLEEKSEISEDFIHEIDKFIKQITKYSDEIVSNAERDQLRANLRFWASLIYEHEGKYPNTNLKAPDLKLREQAAKKTLKTQKSNNIWWILILGFIFISVIMINNQGNSNDQDFNPTPTYTPTSIVGIIDPTVTLIATTTFTTPTPNVGVGLFIDLRNIRNGESVEPEMILKGSYNGLSEGASIHVVLQPINKCGIDNILEENYFKIGEKVEGEWSIPVHFGKDDDLIESEQYNIRIFYAQNEEVREILADNIGVYSECFNIDELPLGFFPYQSLIVNVNRGAYTQIKEYRVFFTSTTNKSDPFDIASTRLDGSDFRLLTNSPDIDERDPHLCKENQKIVFREQNPNGPDSIWTIDSNGENRTLLLSEENTRYEGPKWSYDCRYIAFSTIKDDSQDNYWKLHILDFNNPEAGLINISFGRYPSWASDSLNLIFEHSPQIIEVTSFGIFDLNECILNFNTLEHNCVENPQFFKDQGLPIHGTQPVLSPDNTRLVFSSLPLEEDNTYYQVINAFDVDIGGGVYRITNPTGIPQDWYPVWGPQSNNPLIYFQSYRGLHENIWVIKIDGTEMKAIGPVERINLIPSIGFMDTYLPVEKE